MLILGPSSYEPGHSVLCHIHKAGGFHSPFDLISDIEPHARFDSSLIHCLSPLREGMILGKFDMVRQEEHTRLMLFVPAARFQGSGNSASDACCSRIASDLLESSSIEQRPIWRRTEQFSCMYKVVFAFGNPVDIIVVNLKVSIWRYPAWLNWRNIDARHFRLRILICNLDDPNA